jgi:thymidylate synthase
MLTESGLQVGMQLKSSNIDEAFTATLQAILTHGHTVDTYPSHQSDKVRGSLEILNFQVSIGNPQDRILTNPVRRFNAIEAVARLTWMLGGNNRLADIAFYQPKARFYSDNSLSLPGSNYGQRIFEARPGLNQAEGVLGALRREIGSRRGAIVVWSPEDATRISNDIPCVFGLFFHQRGECFVCTTLMRSNNAFLLLPYDIFVFSLLGEMIATTLGMKLDLYVHTAGSMHVYHDQQQRAYEAVAEPIISSQQHPRYVMPPMPTDPRPFEQGEELARLEAELRHEYALQSPSKLRSCGERLHEYWRAFYDVLLAHALSRAGRVRAAREVARCLPEHFRTSVERTLCS